MPFETTRAIPNKNPSEVGSSSDSEFYNISDETLLYLTHSISAEKNGQRCKNFSPPYLYKLSSGKSDGYLSTD